MDVLYILGTGSKWEDNELRFSLRSLERFAQNVDRVFLTGDNCPRWVDHSHITYNQCSDIGDRALNHIHKVRWTLQNTDIGDRFLLNYDDNFLMAPVDIEAYPFYFKSEELPDRTQTGRAYRYSLINARKFLEAHGKPIKNFSVHCPCIYDKAQFLALEEAWKVAEEDECGIAVRSVLLNWAEIKGEYMSDCKLKTVKSKEEASLAIAGRPVFSIHDNSIENGVAELLTEMFRKPSRYELPGA